MQGDRNNCLKTDNLEFTVVSVLRFDRLPRLRVLENKPLS
jgi:hypothetical protein